MVLIARRDGCRSIQAEVQHLGMRSVPRSAVAMSLVECLPWLRLSSTCGLPGQKILIIFLNQRDFIKAP